MSVRSLSVGVRGAPGTGNRSMRWILDGGTVPVVYLKENRTTQTVCCRDRLKEAERSSNEAQKPGSRKREGPALRGKVRGPLGFLSES